MRHLLVTLGFMYLATACTSFSAAVAAELDPRVGEIVEGIRTARRQLSPGVFQVTAKCTVTPPDYGPYRAATRRFRVAILDEKSLRSFEMEWSSPQRTWNGVTLIRDDEVFLEPGPGSPHASSGQRSSELNLCRYVFDPVSLGLACRPILQMQQTTLDTSLAFISAASDTVLTSESGGAVGLRCTFSGGVMELKVLPENNYSVVKLSKLPRDSNVMEVVESSYRSTKAPEGDGIVWYPSSIVYQRTTDGMVDFEEHVAVEFEAADALSEADFTIQALNLSEGRRLLTEDHRMMVWDHGKLRQVTGKDVYDREQRRYRTEASTHSDATGGLRQENSKTVRWLIVANSAAAIAVACIYGLRKRSRKTNSEERGRTAEDEASALE